MKRLPVQLLPSFLHRFFQDEDPYGGEATDVSKNRQSTAFLDGMRGVAAFCVFMEHFLMPFWGNIFYAYGGNEETTIFQLPVVRLLYSGSPMVCIFFVISGVALTLKPAQLMQKGDWYSLYRTTESMVFRRGIRLFGPCLLVSFAFMLAAALGMCDVQSAIEYEGPAEVLDEFWMKQPQALSFWNQIGDWFEFIFTKVFIPTIWRGTTSGRDFGDPEDTTHEYGSQLWTVAVEYWSSLLLFITVLGTARLRWIPRTLTFAVLVIFSFRVSRWDMALFLFGSAIASTAPFQRWEQGDSKPLYQKIAVWCLLVFGLHLASFPELGGPRTPGFRWFAAIVNNSRYWQSAGAAIIVPCVANLGVLRRLFSCSLLQYLGRISFALYLVHLPLLATLGWRLVPTVWTFAGRDNYLQGCGGLVISFLLILPLVIWMADLFYRFVDKPCISFARKLENYFRIPDS